MISNAVQSGNLHDVGVTGMQKKFHKSGYNPDDTEGMGLGFACVLVL